MMTERDYKNIKDKIRQGKDTEAVLLFLLEHVYNHDKGLDLALKNYSYLTETMFGYKDFLENEIYALAKMTHRAIEFDDPGVVQVDIFTPTTSDETEEEDDD